MAIAAVLAGAAAARECGGFVVRGGAGPRRLLPPWNRRMARRASTSSSNLYPCALHRAGANAPLSLVVLPQSAADAYGAKCLDGTVRRA